MSTQPRMTHQSIMAAVAAPQGQKVQDAAVEFLNGLFESTDTLCLTFIHATRTNPDGTAVVENDFLPLKDVISSDGLQNLEDRNQGGWNVYVSMAPFKPGAKRRKLDEIKGASHVFADIDKDGKGSLGKLKKLIDAGTVPSPAFIVESSPNKFQAIWNVGNLTVEEARNINCGLIAALDSDPACKDVARVLRIPGYCNLKPKYNRPMCRIFERGDSDIHSFADFKLEIPKNGFKPPYRLPDEIIEGDPGRNNELTRFAGSLRAKGSGTDEILEALRAVNHKRCKPPLPDSDLQKITNSIMNYPAGTASAALHDVPPTTGHEAEDEPEPIITEEPLPLFPDIFTGTIADLARAVAPDLPYCLKFMVALTIIGSLLSGHIHIAGSEHIDPRFYTVMIDSKGAGKGGSVAEVRAVLNDLIAERLNIAPSLDSGPALVLEMAQHPRTMLYADELDKVFETAKPTGSSRNSLFAELLTLHDGHETGNNAKANFNLPKEVRRQVCGHSANIKVNKAHFSLLGGVQPSVFQEMWRGVKGGASGLQSRFILVSSGNTSVPEPQRPSDSIAVPQIVESLTAQVTPYLDIPGKIRISKELGDTLHGWWEERRELYPKASTRTPAILMRMLTVLAVTNGLQEITPELINQAFAFGEYQIQMAERFMPSDAMTWTAAFEELILNCFRKHGKRGLTLNQVRRLVNPEKHQLLGGFGPFKQAWENLKSTGAISSRRNNVRGFGIFMLDEGNPS